MPRAVYDPVYFAGTAFNRGASPEPGVLWYIDTLDGWEDTAEPVTAVASFGYSDGVVAAPRFPKKEQYIGLSGVVTAPDADTAERYKDILSGMFDSDDTVQVVKWATRAKAMDLRRSGTWHVVKDLGPAFRWACTMMAVWPYKYSPAAKTASVGVFAGGDYYRTYSGTGPYYRTYSGTGPYYFTYTAASSGTVLPTSVTLNNAGTADAWPEYRVLGPLTRKSWSISNDTTGEQISFGMDLARGQELVLNSRNQSAWLGIQPVEYYISGSWPRLIPGANDLRLMSGADNPDARLTITYHDTWKR